MRKNPIRDILHERFPACFAGRGEAKRPLAINIAHTIVIQCPDLRGKIKLALRDYTGGPTYHCACIEGATRIDLNGDPAGVVTKKHADYHVSRMESLKQGWQRRQQQQQQQGNQEAT